MGMWSKTPEIETCWFKGHLFSNGIDLPATLVRSIQVPCKVYPMLYSHIPSNLGVCHEYHALEASPNVLCQFPASPLA